MEKEEAIVLYPSPAIGHLLSMVELGKLLLTHKPSLTIHILISPQPYSAGSTAPYIAAVSATNPAITFHNLPNVTLPPTSSPHHETLILELLRLNNPNLHQSLRSISKSYTIHALIMDFFCSHALSVAADLNIPGYYFLTSGAGFLAYLLYLAIIHRSTTKSLKDLNTLLHIPGIPPIPSSDSPKPFLDRNDDAYKGFLNSSVSVAKSAGVIVNTFESLEPRVIKSISDGLCILDGPTPPIFCIGPQIATSSSERSGGEEAVPECLRWLDLQPSGSVVYLCFGSLGLFSKEQLKEIAIGLERSGLRFLWVVRNPPTKGGQSLAVTVQPEPELDLLLPKGFLESTKERGLLLKSWAPQVAVLNHKSVGGFVTHCGWNSVLEAVCGGVPMVAWPLYAEQRFNRVILVEEIRIALPMEESSEDGFVGAVEVEKRVRELMESEEGKSIRERMLYMKNEAKVALSEGGSSRVALAKFCDSWKQN